MRDTFRKTGPESAYDMFAAEAEDTLRPAPVPPVTFAMTSMEIIPVPSVIASMPSLSPVMIPLAAFFKNSRFWLIGLSYFAVAGSLYGITTFMVDYAKYQLMLPLEKASLLATIHGFSQIIGVLTVLPFSDYIGRKKTIVISNTIITGALLGILLK